MDAINPTTIWFIAGTVLALLEFVAPGIILIFFAIGAWIVALTTWLGLTGSLETQLLVFAVSSVILLVSLRRWIKGKFYGHVTGLQNPEQNLDEFTGKPVKVLEEVTPGRPGGKVEFKGTVWSAVSDEPIGKDEMAVITAVEGISLRIAKAGQGGGS